MKKTMKAMLALVLAAMLLSSAALATAATYANTKDTIASFDGVGLYYTVQGIEDKGYEVVTLGNTSDYWDYTIAFFFNEDNTSVGIRIWDLAAFDEAEIPEALLAVNRANEAFKYARFYIEESDNTLTCSYDIVVREGASVGDIVLEATARLTAILDQSYPYFEDLVG